VYRAFPCRKKLQVYINKALESMAAGGRQLAGGSQQQAAGSKLQAAAGRNDTHQIIFTVITSRIVP
jgi:hypothetical protein